MCGRGQGHEAAPRYPSRRVWSSCVSKSHCQQGIPTWFLLADCTCSSGELGEVNGCQRFKSLSHQPASALKTIPIAWPFAVWGLDMVGPFRTARGGMTHLLVA